LLPRPSTLSRRRANDVPALTCLHIASYRVNFTNESAQARLRVDAKNEIFLRDISSRSFHQRARACVNVR
jgi:hypothetical protein